MSAIPFLLVGTLLLVGCLDILPANAPPPTPNPTAASNATVAATPTPIEVPSGTPVPLPTIFLPAIQVTPTPTLNATTTPAANATPTATPSANASMSCSVSPAFTILTTPDSVTVTARFTPKPSGVTAAQIFCTPTNVGTSLISTEGFASLTCTYPAQSTSSTVTLRASAGGTECTSPLTVLADTVAPVLSSTTNGTVTATTAVITWSTDEDANAKVEYGTTTSLGSTTTATSTYTRNQSVTISSLTASTTYFYHAVSCDPANNCGNSTILNFITPAAGPADTTPPTVTMSSPTNTTYASTSVNANVTVNKAASTCRYSLDAGANTTMGNTSTTAWSATLSGLAEGSHNVIVYCTDLANNNGFSPLVYFTADAAAPTFSSIAASSITNNSAIITWTTNELATAWVEYGTTASYGTNTTVNSTLALNHNQTLSGLSNGTQYFYRPWGCDAATNCAAGAGSSFNTTA